MRGNIGAKRRVRAFNIFSVKILRDSLLFSEEHLLWDYTGSSSVIVTCSINNTILSSLLIWVPIS